MQAAEEELRELIKVANDPKDRAYLLIMQQMVKGIGDGIVGVARVQDCVDAHRAEFKTLQDKLQVHDAVVLSTPTDQHELCEFVRTLKSSMEARLKAKADFWSKVSQKLAENGIWVTFVFIGGIFLVGLREEISRFIHIMK